MKIPIFYFDSTNQYRVWGGQTGDPLFAGNFGHREHNGDHRIYSLDEFDTNLIRGMELKAGEQVFRCETDCSKVSNIRYMVKINLERGLVYFPEHNENDEIRFERKGVQLRFLSLRQDLSVVA